MPDLPPVEQTWSADTAPFVAGIQAAIDALKEFDAQMDDNLAKLAEFKAALDALDGRTVDINLEGVPEDIAEVDQLRAVIDELPVVHDTDVNVTGIASDIAGVESLRAQLDSLPKVEDIKVDVDSGALGALTGEAAAAAARDTDDLATALRDVEDAAAPMEGAMAGADRAFADVASAANTSKGPIASWFSQWKTVIHWVVSGSAEFLAVAVPALIALGSYALDAAQGFTFMYDHLQSLYAVQEATGPMFNKTAGDILGIGHAIQQAQNQINGQVYELFGAYIEVAKTHLANFASMGETVSGQVDEFSAKIVQDMNGAFGKEIQDLIGGATDDLDHLAGTLGNLGHALLNVAHSMPGLAEFLAQGLDDITGFIAKLTSIPFVQTIGMWMMAAEEFYRWGGLLTGMLTKIFGVSQYAQAAAADGGFIAKFGANIKALANGAGNAVSSLGGFTEKQAEAGKAAAAAGEDAGKFRSAISTAANVAGNAASSIGSGMTRAGETIANMADSVSPLQAAFITLAAVGIAAVIIKIATLKDAAQQLEASMQNALGKVSNYQAPEQIAQNIAILGQHIQTTRGQLNDMTNSTNAYNAAGGRSSAIINATKNTLGQYQQGLGQASQNETDFAKNASAIEKQFGVSYPQAIAIAEGANIKLAKSTVEFGKDMNNSGQQITDFMKGMQAMGAGSGAIGNDLKAVDISAQETQTKVQTLNQAWDQFMQGITGGTNDFAQLENAMGNMKTDAAASSASLTGSISSIKQAAGNMAYSLKGDTATSQQSWQQFDQALGSSAESLADWFRQAGSEGQLGSGQFVSAIKDMVAQFVPLTQGNKTAVSELSALAQQAGGPATSNLKTLKAWLGNTGDASKQLQSIINSTTDKMSNMSKVASNLGGVLDSQVDSAISSNIMQQTGLNSKIQTYTQDLTTLGPHNTTTINALHQMQSAYNEASKAAQQGANATKNFGNAAQTASGQINGAVKAANALQKAIDDLPSSKTINIQIQSTEFLHTVATGGKGAHGGMVTPMGVIPGYASGGILPGFEPGVDRILAALSPGEAVLNPYAVRMLGAEGVNWLNRAAEHGANPGGGMVAGGGGVGGTGGGGGHHIHLYLDGKEIFASVKQQGSQYNTRNAGARTGLLIPGQKVGSGIS